MYYNPLYILYRKGPSFNGFGFWCGKSNIEICSILTNTNMLLWNSNDDQCIDIITRHYESFEIMVHIFLLFTTVYKVLSYISTYITIIRPIQQTLYTLHTETSKLN